MAKNFFCVKPWTSFQIDDHKGNVNACCWSKIKCGNINNATIEEIWNGTAYVYIRELMAQGNIDLICTSDCPYRIGELSEEYIEPKSDIYKNNFLLQEDEIATRKTVLKSKPRMMRVVPTVNCNLNCVMCYQDRHDTVELPNNTEQLLSQYFPVLQELLILGGEPLVSQRCLQIIESMDPNNYPDLHLALITNGTAVTKKTEKLLLNRRISWILVSIDAVTQETFKLIRGGSLEKVLDGVKRLKSLRETQNDNWRLIIGFTMMRSNMKEAVGFVDLAEQLGVEFIFTPVFGNWHSESFTQMDLEQLQDAISKLEDYLVCKGKDRIKAARLRLMLQTLKV